MSNETVPLSEAKAKLSEYAARVEDGHERVTVTRNGRPSFVMVAADDLESLEETLALLSDPDAMASIRAGQEEAARGRTIPLDDVLREEDRRRGLTGRS
jgi:antitoxin YefM